MPQLPGYGQAKVLHHLADFLLLTRKGTASGGQFGWGGTPSKGKQGRPMLSSFRSEIGSRGLITNAGLTVFRKAWNAETKVGYNEHCCLVDRGTICQTSYPGGNRLVAGESTHRPRGLVHRCRLGTSWSCRSGQGLGCSSIKVPHELGSVRRETVRQYLLEVLFLESKDL